MFDDTWRWAGQYRKTGKNIGVQASRIPESLANLLKDTEYWIEHGTFSGDEIGVRFHHRLVSIHPFANGNGRHARLMADALLEELGVAPFTWGSASLIEDRATRSAYLAALHHADAGDYQPLLAFVRK
jgi:Fic-DOC domain mobile mystery protein B